MSEQWIIERSSVEKCGEGNDKITMPHQAEVHRAWQLWNSSAFALAEFVLSALWEGKGLSAMDGRFLEFSCLNPPCNSTMVRIYIFYIMRGRLAGLLRVVNMELSLRTTECVLNFAGRYLLVKQDAVLTITSIFPIQRRVMQHSSLLVILFSLLWKSPSVTSPVRGIFNVLKGYPKLRHTPSRSAET